jgi:hypothetical protein
VVDERGRGFDVRLGNLRKGAGSIKVGAGSSFILHCTCYVIGGVSLAPPTRAEPNY